MGQELKAGANAAICSDSKGKEDRELYRMRRFPSAWYVIIIDRFPKSS